MDISRFKYLVNVSCFLEVTELSVDTGRCYGDPLNAYVEFPEEQGADQETLAEMFYNDDTLFTIPGYEELFDLKSVCREEDSPYWIRLKSIGNSIKDAVGLKEITSWEEYYELHAKITTERSDDGSVTFSVPTLQGLRIREDAVPVFVSHAEKSVKEAMPKYVINIETIFGCLSHTNSFDGLIYECVLNDKTYESLSLLYKNKDSVLLVVSGYAPVYRAVRAELDSEKKKIKVCMSIDACYNNVRKDVTWLHSLEDLKAIGDESKVPWNAGMLTYNVEDVMPKGELPKNTLSEVVTEICSSLGLSVKSPLERELMFCRGGRGNGKPIFDPSNPEHRSIIMSQALREMMMPIEDKYPQLHRARLNKPKSI